MRAILCEVQPCATGDGQCNRRNSVNLRSDCPRLVNSEAACAEVLTVSSNDLFQGTRILGKIEIIPSNFFERSRIYDVAFSRFRFFNFAFFLVSCLAFAESSA